MGLAVPASISGGLGGTFSGDFALHQCVRRRRQTLTFRKRYALRRVSLFHVQLLDVELAGFEDMWEIVADRLTTASSARVKNKLPSSGVSARGAHAERGIRR